MGANATIEVTGAPLLTDAVLPLSSTPHREAGWWVPCPVPQQVGLHSGHKVLAICQVSFLAFSRFCQEFSSVLCARVGLMFRGFLSSLDTDCGWQGQNFTPLSEHRPWLVTLVLYCDIASNATPFLLALHPP